MGAQCLTSSPAKCSTHVYGDLLTFTSPLQIPQGPRTEAALRNNISVGVQYLEAWLGGLGCVPLHSLMEDAATAEISRTQVWQWLRHGAALDGGSPLTIKRFNQVRHPLISSTCFLFCTGTYCLFRA